MPLECQLEYSIPDNTAPHAPETGIESRHLWFPIAPTNSVQNQELRVALGSGLEFQSWHYHSAKLHQCHLDFSL